MFKFYQSSSIFTIFIHLGTTGWIWGSREATVSCTPAMPCPQPTGVTGIFTILIKWEWWGQPSKCLMNMYYFSDICHSLSDAHPRLLLKSYNVSLKTKITPDMYKTIYHCVIWRSWLMLPIIVFHLLLVSVFIPRLNVRSMFQLVVFLSLFST